MGRPKKPIDEDAVRQLARLQCTHQEIADVFGCHKDTIADRFSDIIKEERAIGVTSLRTLQYRACRRGNSALLIWLGKQWLGQTDKVEHIQDRGVNFDIPPDDRPRPGRGESD